jgi:hypothetical protein
MTVIKLPEPPLDLVEVYLGLVDSNPEMKPDDPRLAAIRSAMTERDRRLACKQLRAESEAKLRRARALEIWRLRGPNR